MLLRVWGLRACRGKERRQGWWVVLAGRLTSSSSAIQGRQGCSSKRLSQSSGQARRVPPKGDGDHVFKVGCMYWLEYVNQNMPKAHWQRFVGKWTERVKWAWMDETGSASRWISEAKSEGVRLVTQEELKIMCSDFGHALEDVLCAMLQRSPPPVPHELER